MYHYSCLMIFLIILKGGLVMATGMTTHSHVCGLTHDTVISFEIVTASGEYM